MNDAKIISPDGEFYFLPYQEKWILDTSPLRIIQKSRQVGITYADAYDSVIKASEKDARLDVWISSRDQAQAKLYLEDCKYWAVFLHVYFLDLGLLILDEKTNSSAYVLQFANGRRIYCLSSNPNALAGKRGHVKLDEFALHQDQRLLYKVAKPVTTWGGQLSIISTHRGVADPAASVPHATFTLKLASTTILTTATDVPTGGWHLRAAITVRASGTTGTVVGSIVILMDNTAVTPFPITCPTATVNTTGSLTVDLLASIADVTAAESVICDQLTIHLE